MAIARVESGKTVSSRQSDQHHQQCTGHTYYCSTSDFLKKGGFVEQMPKIVKCRGKEELFAELKTIDIRFAFNGRQIDPKDREDKCK
jgi:hypothetical protein